VSLYLVQNEAIKDGVLVLKTLMKLFSALLILNVSSVFPQAQTIGNEEAGDIQALVQTLDADLAAFQFLLGKIESAEKTDREQLFYRQDERVFKILADYDTLASQVAGLPEGSPQRVAVTQQLAEFARGTVTDTDSALFGRIPGARSRTRTAPCSVVSTTLNKT
jgi:hypothetical protein